MRLISFGFLHVQEPPPADLNVDVRRRLDDPAAYAAVLSLLETSPVDGRDSRVQAIVMRQRAARDLLDELAASPCASIAIGCAQGHDRSVALAELLAARVRLEGRAATVNHLHVQLPRVR